MKKPLITLLAILGALAAAAALLYVFRDKIKALFNDVKDKCSCKCDEDELVEDIEEAPAEKAPEEAPEETPEETAE